MNLTNESIFSSIVRSFFKTFSVILAIGFGIVVIALGLSGVSNKISSPDKSEFTVLPDANWNQKLLSESTPVILQIDIHGIIGTVNMKGAKVKQMLVDSRTGALDDNRVKGLLLHINTPGGTVTDSRLIYRLIQSYKKRYNTPVFAYVDGLCASGGIYVACAADKVYSSEDSVIGSVGVRLGPIFNVYDAMGKVGISALTLTEGKDKDALNTFRKWTEGESNELQKVLAAQYDLFLNIVSENRPQLTEAKLRNDYGANVFIASQAAEYGYVDEVAADYNKALKDLVAACGIKEEDKYQVIKVGPSQSFFKDLTSGKFKLLNGKLEHTLPDEISLQMQLSGQPLFLYQP